ncbi:hypothetical protein WICANDRAFT_67237 [Wickerhamomyces anomalus NRRL Y-366-8]|uniref:Uncharacterized protein n=1 Tax=Wickerhamomyces anomalus (strain ATCC 58044 / CBS 1984 / NCYC 433 / NRRL Y-366-8) TaxID=683960 RepID=A0A1E3P4Y5_WICAA|nr:uncharacterized protein WICANDRAFT_67237 [Wickerhamomyces anomalus NRRL Y-366-8]ODQ60526.1 hypothetical protein WICANDRAFT_67237 [Wickerhamomyces anomalus NRRL Y-366-8]
MSNDNISKKLDSILGLEIKVSNILDVETIGTVYSYIAVPSTLIIQVPSQTAAGSSFNYKVLRTSNIKSLEVISKKIDSSKIAKITEVDASQVPQITKRNTEAIELKKKLGMRTQLRKDSIYSIPFTKLCQMLDGKERPLSFWMKFR